MDIWKPDRDDLIEIGEGTDFTRFIGAMAQGTVYIDPALKLENAFDGTPKTKRRNQFRIKPKDLASLYNSFKRVDLAGFNDKD